MKLIDKDVLVKLEVKGVDDKSVWSEEDDRHLSIAIQYVFEHGYLSTADWLRTLKERIKGE